MSQNNLIMIEDLQMIYQVGNVEVPALRGVSFTVKEGDFVAIMGPSGCGKSTLLHIIGGLLNPTSGRVLIDGLDIGSISDAKRTEIRRQKIGFVFQRFNLLPTLSVQDNIELARRLRDNSHFKQQNSLELLELLGLEEKMRHKPSQLSTGEQQRVAIARALVSRPAILLADEPTGNLDTDNSQTVLGMMQELNHTHNQSIIMITHNPEAAAMAGRIIEMRDGRILNPVQDSLYAVEQNTV